MLVIFTFFVGIITILLLLCLECSGVGDGGGGEFGGEDGGWGRERDMVVGRFGEREN